MPNRRWTRGLNRDLSPLEAGLLDTKACCQKHHIRETAGGMHANPEAILGGAYFAVAC